MILINIYTFTTMPVSKIFFWNDAAQLAEPLVEQILPAIEYRTH